MNNHFISTCCESCTDENHCSLTTTRKGWGCKLLVTTIGEVPVADQEKAKLFVQVYREAKQKGVLECPHYRSSIIDEVLDNISQMTSLPDFYQAKITQY